ncbi:hypothetical protein DFQ29_009497 [Apophysomyces sp. BC1021]|nr:hypothetical protein DFQ29_009497 [Apophysomyces sp. BC1021]
MDFSPYKPSPDEDRSTRLQKERQKNKQNKGKSKNTAESGTAYSPYQSGVPGTAHTQTSASLLEEGLFTDAASLGNSSRGAPAGMFRVNKYETTLPIRVDVEAALAYILGPVTGKVWQYLHESSNNQPKSAILGLFFLICERQNDYVRFHAWQSTLVSLTLMSIHFVLMFISSFLSWTLFFVDVGLLVWLTYRAYLDGASLERYELPYAGPLASEWVDTE